MEPLKGGRLTDAFPEEVAKFWKEADTQRTPAEWAFRWLADIPEVLTILSGMTTMSQTEENIKTLSEATPGCLTEKERAIFDKVAEVYNSLIQYPCTACNYCMPCPQKLNIPVALDLYNQWFLYAKSQKTKDDYSYSFPKGRTVSDCKDCGICLDRCPQKLPISEAMAKAAEIFDK